MKTARKKAVEVAKTDTRLFSCGGSVVVEGGLTRVLIHGTLIGCFGPKSIGSRNAILMGLAAGAKMHLGQLAKAFGISRDGLRKLRLVYERDGLVPLLGRKPRRLKFSLSVRQQIENLFDNGASVSEAHAKVGKKHGLGRGTVGRIRLAWWTRQQSALLAQSPAAIAPEEPSVPNLETAPAKGRDNVESILTTDDSVDVDVDVAFPVEPDEKVGNQGPSNESSVQHVGSWLLVAMVNKLGLHQQAQSMAQGLPKNSALRVALDAVIIALAVGQGCVEGVRRLATATAASLMLASHMPSQTWTRRVLGQFSMESRGLALHLAMAQKYVETARDEASEAGPVFYIDNHLRPYTGQETIRRGWRMQDKRVQPGTTDYYVHDEDGHPVGRLPVPAHDSLTKWLSPLAKVLRHALEDATILLAFDRAGAFPKQMAQLRNDGFEFVTYERKPYPQLPASEFTKKFTIGEEQMTWCESRTNLGAGHGRVRRISLRMPDGYQVNLLAISKRPAKALAEIMAHRWRQENGFKHGVERWGINQLDGRTVVPYSPDTVIPNPARRRLDGALRIAKIREGLARTNLSRLKKDDKRRAKLQSEIAEAMATQDELQKLRPSTPLHDELQNTELADKLVHHTYEYKMTIDTIRIACANAEATLASELALHLPRASEAKKTLANLFAAPGNIRVDDKHINVCLQPAGTGREQAAYASALAVINSWSLWMPGDQKRRQLHFSISRIL